MARKIRNDPNASKLSLARFRHFPNYPTFLAQTHLTDLQLIDLSKRQTNALSHFTGWVVDERSDEIARFLELK